MALTKTPASQGGHQADSPRPRKPIIHPHHSHEHVKSSQCFQKRGYNPSTVCFQMESIIPQIQIVRCWLQHNTKEKKNVLLRAGWFFVVAFQGEDIVRPCVGIILQSI